MNDLNPKVPRKSPTSLFFDDDKLYASGVKSGSRSKSVTSTVCLKLEVREQASPVLQTSQNNVLRNPFHEFDESSFNCGIRHVENLLKSTLLRSPGTVSPTTPRLLDRLHRSLVTASRL